MHICSASLFRINWTRSYETDKPNWNNASRRACETVKSCTGNPTYTVTYVCFEHFCRVSRFPDLSFLHLFTEFKSTSCVTRLTGELFHHDDLLDQSRILEEWLAQNQASQRDLWEICWNNACPKTSAYVKFCLHLVASFF